MKQSILDINKQIANLQKRKDKIQAKCPHVNAVKNYDSNTGNFDPNDDQYWVCFNCLDCEKQWTKHSKV